MQKIITLLVLSIASLSAAAQSIFVKIGGGFASQYDAAGYSGSAKIAFGYEHELSQTFAFAPSIGVTARGWQVADVSTPDMLFDDKGNATGLQRPVVDSEGNPVEGKFMYSMMHRSYAANYLQLDLPFNYYHRLGESRYLTLTAGPWVACGIAGNRSTEGDGRACGDRKIRYTDRTFSLPGAHRFDCGLKAGVGYQFPSSLTINLEGEFGLLKTNSVTAFDAQGLPDAVNDPFAGRAGRNVGVMLTLSYRLNKSKWKGDD